MALKALRESRGLTVLELSDKTKINYNVIILLEEGKIYYTHHYLLILSDFFDVPTNFFFGSAGYHYYFGLMYSFFDEYEVWDKRTLNFRYLRAVNWIKQKDLAKLMGVSPATISGLETGKVQFNDKHIKKYCEYFNVPMSLVLNINTKNKNEKIYKNIRKTKE